MQRPQHRSQCPQSSVHSGAAPLAAVGLVPAKIDLRSPRDEMITLPPCSGSDSSGRLCRQVKKEYILTIGVCFEYVSAEVNRGRQYLLLDPMTELVKRSRFQWPGFQRVPAFSLAGSSQVLSLPAKERRPRALISQESAVAKGFSVQLCNFSNICQAGLWHALVFLLVQPSSLDRSDVNAQTPR